MKHLTFGDKALFVGDEVANALVAYAALLAERGRADSVVVNAIGPDGHAVEATFLLNSGTNLMAESADDMAFQQPDNTGALEYMARRSEAILRPPSAQPMSRDEMGEFEDSYRDQDP